MLLIYSPSITPRLKYTFDLIFHELLGVKFTLTTNKEEFISGTGPRLNYSDHPFGSELFFYASRLLFEKGIEDQNLAVFDWNPDGNGTGGTKAFFATHPKYIFPFDPFAASFYLVSRYEEYLPHIRDEHDRYDTRESLAYQKNFLDKPLVNIWAIKIKEELQKKFPELVFAQRKYKYISTIDIDNAYAFLEKGIMRTAGAYARSLVNLDFEDFTERTKVLLGAEKDPYDTFDYQLELQKKHKFKTIYFILLGEYGMNDKNVPADSKKLRSLIKSLADYSEVGIHPSYGSNKNKGNFKKEVNVLNKILKREVTKSRQHFLILKLPSTYRQLIDLDITDDYTMGYALQVGFRASICSTFYFYDLDMEQTTSLRIHPFAVMDATLKYYMKVPPHEAMNYIRPLIEEVKAVNGTFISLWHNESLSENRLWAGWKSVYEQMTELAAN
ncbi:MAG TPA: polysaccharide deacetylase family protein [Bacteroidia bacterium]|nr:polysaccharide deacetylase family protein [Bacteroidia bacterium]